MVENVWRLSLLETRAPPQEEASGKPRTTRGNTQADGKVVAETWISELRPPLQKQFGQRIDTVTYSEP